MLDYLLYENPSLSWMLMVMGCLAIGAIAGLIVREIRSRDKSRRGRELEGLARELGLQFAPDGLPEMPLHFRLQSLRVPGAPEDAWDRGELAGLGRCLRPGNVVHGTIGGRTIWAWDSETEHGDVSVLNAMGDWDVPPTVIRPERWTDRLDDAFGLNDIDFDDHREFSDRFYVYSREEPFARAVLTPEVMETLLANSGWSIEMDGSDVRICDGKRWRPERFKEALAFLDGFLDSVPQFRLHSPAARVGCGQQDRGGRPWKP
jgi:hypothetical protein